MEEPEQKRKIIGEEFIRVFEEEAKKLGKMDFLCQGTIYPDVVESGTGEAAVIKSHHNVGGLPEDIGFEGLVEPLRDLFKDEVRRVGLELGIPENLVWRQPFPGPGLAVRIMGEVTGEKLDILQEADAIFREEVANAGLTRDVDQYFAVLTANRSVGVMGDGRTYGVHRGPAGRDHHRLYDRRLGPHSLRRAGQDLQPHRQRGPGRQPRGVRHHQQTPGHHRVGMTLETAKTRMNTGFFARPYCS